MLALLDVSVLVALGWRLDTRPSRKRIAWFARHAAAGWATCPLTQAGFVGILSNPAFSPRAVTPREAIAALAVYGQTSRASALEERPSTGLTCCSFYTLHNSNYRTLYIMVFDLARRSKGR